MSNLRATATVQEGLLVDLWHLGVENVKGHDQLSIYHIQFFYGNWQFLFVYEHVCFKWHEV